MLLKDFNMPMLNAAASLLASSGPSRMPVGTGQLIGKGLLGYMQGKQYEDNFKRQQSQDDLDKRYKESLIAKNQLGVTGDIGSYNPRDYTPESWAQFIQSKDPSALKRYEPFSTIDLGGGMKGILDRSTGRTIGTPNTKEEFVQNVTDVSGAEEGAKQREKRGSERLKELDISKSERVENIKEASELLELLNSGKIETGKVVDAARLLPGVNITRLNAFAEQAARAQLKANGEIRPTDADVLGMKRALFGADKVEGFNIQSLERMIRVLQSQEEEYRVLNEVYGDKRLNEQERLKNMIDEMLK